MSEHVSEVLRAEQAYLYRAGGRPPARWVMVFGAIVCGIAPLLLLVPLGIAERYLHLEGVPVTATVIDWGIGLSVILAAVWSRWGAMRDRLFIMLFAAFLAAVLRMGIFAESVRAELDQTQALHWIVCHLIDTSILVTAFVVALRTVGGWSPWSAKRGSRIVRTAGRARRRPQPAVQSDDYRHWPAREQRARRLGTGGLA